LVAAWSAPGGRCLCGSHITQRALLSNRLTGRRALLGCCCVRHFPAAARLFRTMARVMADPTRPLNPAAVESAYGRGFLTPWARGFALSTRGRRLSARMRAKRLEVHHELFVRMAAAGGRAVSSDKTRAKASPAGLGSLRGGANARENPGTTDGGRNA
jgi:hypothetical protein